MYNYDLHATTETEKFFNSLTPEIVIVIAILSLIVLAAITLMLVSNCLIFKKAGEKAWKGIIPLYSSWVETKISGLAWYWFLIFFVLCAVMEMFKDTNYVIAMGLVLTAFNYNYNMAKKFGKSNGFAFLCTILPVIGLPILAFGSSKYKKDAKVDKNGIFSIEK